MWLRSCILVVVISESYLLSVSFSLTAGLAEDTLLIACKGVVLRIFPTLSSAFMDILWMNVISHLGKWETFIRVLSCRWALSSMYSAYLEAWLGLVHIPPAQDPHLVM